MVFLNMYLKHILAIQFEIKQTQKHHETSLTNRTSLTTVVSPWCPAVPVVPPRRPGGRCWRCSVDSTAQRAKAPAPALPALPLQLTNRGFGKCWPLTQLTNLWKLLLDGGCRKELPFSLIFFEPFSGVFERCCASCKLWCEGISKHAFKNLWCHIVSSLLSPHSLSRMRAMGPTHILHVTYAKAKV